MSENKSSASHEQIMPAGKPSTSFVVEPGPSSIPGNEGVSIGSTSKSSVSESFATKGADADMGGKSIMPASKPDSTLRVDWTK